MQPWIVVGSAENFELLRERGFDLCAFKSSRRRETEAMQPGDRLAFYLTKVVQFGGIAEVTGEGYEDDADVGLVSEGKPGERFPFRIPTKPVLVPPPDTNSAPKTPAPMGPTGWANSGPTPRSNRTISSSCTSWIPRPTPRRSP